MKRLDNGDYLVHAIRASQAVDMVRNYVPPTQAPSITATRVFYQSMETLWLVHPNYTQPTSQTDDTELATAEWVGSVAPEGWSVVLEPKQGLLVIRNQHRTLCMVQTMLANTLSRGQLRRAFAQLGVQIE